MKKIVLTGVKPTGSPHIGNYIGAIKPALDFMKNDEYLHLYFIADYHALTIIKDAKQFKQLTYEVAATWLALGLNPEKVVFYRQSDIPEIFELNWILSCVTPKGWMNKAHAYKAAVDKNKELNQEKDSGINMGLYNYPILMASDILLFNTDLVPVGKDQVQHVEIIRDIANYFNKTYSKTIRLPDYITNEDTGHIIGLDGRKMSKSYNNTIPLFTTEKQLKKSVNSIITDSTPPKEPKNPDSSTIFKIYQHFATEKQINNFRDAYQMGISWGDAKEELFNLLNQFLQEPREIYAELMANPAEIEEKLALGAERARSIAAKNLENIRKKIGRF